jgi:hypothetical protein
MLILEFPISVSRSLNPDTCANLCFPMHRVSQLGAWFNKWTFLEQLLINLTIRVRPQPAQEREAVTAEAPASGAGGCGLPMEPVLDVLPVRWTSDLCQLACYDLRDEGKSPIHSSRR